MSPIIAVNVGSSSVRLAAYREDGVCIESARHTGKHSAAELLASFARSLDKPVAAVAHRVVHGGDRFVEPCRIDGPMLEELERLSGLAPLHNPPALEWIRASREVFGEQILHVAVFDTAFFAPLPEVAKTYALPGGFGYRRYGFHGLAHQDMWRQWRSSTGRGQGRVISLQLGSGCSMAAVRDGAPLDTSMGFSPLEGLMMATRPGDIDPGVLIHLMRAQGMTVQALERLLNMESGLRGVSGFSADMRDLLGSEDPRAQLAVELYCYRARKYLGAYMAVLGGVDGIVFGGGVGENVPLVRAKILQGLRWAGVDIDERRNEAAAGAGGRIEAAGAAPILVAQVNEERILAQAARKVLEQSS